MALRTWLSRQKWQQTYRESTQLAAVCWVAWRQPQPDIKTVVIQQARQEGNAIAVRLLLWEKEWGLIRYHGLTGYIEQTQWWKSRFLNRKRRIRHGFLSSCKSTNSLTEGLGDKNAEITSEKTRLVIAKQEQQSKASNLSPNTVGKVAFMVTSRMKAQLKLS